MKYTEQNFRSGDKIIITKKPGYWSSTYSSNCPLSLKYPYEAIIDKIGEKIIDGKRIIMMSTLDIKGKDYGWDLTDIVYDNKIKKVSQEVNYEIY